MLTSSTLLRIPRETRNAPSSALLWTAALLPLSPYQLDMSSSEAVSAGYSSTKTWTASCFSTQRVVQCFFRRVRLDSGAVDVDVLLQV